jgi:hypothetical protein
MKAIGMPVQRRLLVARKQQPMAAASANSQHLPEQFATLLSVQMIMTEYHP